MSFFFTTNHNFNIFFFNYFLYYLKNLMNLKFGILNVDSYKNIYIYTLAKTVYEFKTH